MKGIDLVNAGKDQQSESRNDHDYSLNAVSQNLLAQLNIQAVKMFHDVVVQYLPVLEPDDWVYIVNIFLNICTCTSFVHKGQSYFVSIYMQCWRLHRTASTT